MTIAKELHALLGFVNHDTKIILIDPLSARDYIFKEQLTDQEYVKSGVDKSQNLLIMEKGNFPNIPLALITHSSDFAIEESMQFGNNTRVFAAKIEDMWQNLMKEYLDFSNNSIHLQADHNGHYIHLTEPELILQEAERMIVIP